MGGRQGRHRVALFGYGEGGIEPRIELEGKGIEARIFELGKVGVS